MPGEDLQSWSTSAAANSSADSLINWAEGQARNSVNNSARSMMAAHAKDRNLKNGLIVTTGTANVQAFLSGLTYTTVPTGLRVLLKIGAGLSNTSSTTLNMDNIADVAIKNLFGSNLLGGELAAGAYYEFLYDGTNWLLLSQTTGIATPTSGILTRTSATALSFAPYRGDRIKINGTIFQIPAAGITGLANTSVFVNGVAAQNLAASTLYRVYAFSNSGVVTADYSTTGHATSATVGNEGTEIKSGDDTRTLIGLVLTNASSQFVDSAAQRWVRSWFNAPRASFDNNANFGPAGPTTPASTGVAVSFIQFANEPVSLVGSGFFQQSTLQQNNFFQFYLDLATPFGSIYAITNTAVSFYTPMAIAGANTPAEGSHTATIYFNMTGGSNTGTLYVSGTLG